MWQDFQPKFWSTWHEVHEGWDRSRTGPDRSLTGPKIGTGPADRAISGSLPYFLNATSPHGRTKFRRGCHVKTVQHQLLWTLCNWNTTDWHCSVEMKLHIRLQGKNFMFTSFFSDGGRFCFFKVQVGRPWCIPCRLPYRDSLHNCKHRPSGGYPGGQWNWSQGCQCYIWKQLISLFKVTI